jgi:hypothetical protein
MKPLMYSVKDAATKGIGWRRWGEEIVYYKNNLTYDKEIFALKPYLNLY